MGAITIRKLADTENATRVRRYDPITGQPSLVNPETGRAEPWPFKGIEFVGEIPEETTLSTSFVSNGIAEGWIETGEATPIFRPGGPPNNKWAVTHTFLHTDRITFKTVHGDVVYEVVQNPDKFVDSDDPDEEVTDEHYENGNTRVDWFYKLRLVSNGADK